MYRRFATRATLAVVLTLSTPALAVDVPSSVEPSRTEKNIVPLRIQRPLAPQITMPESAPPAAAPTGAEKITLTLKSIKIDGMTAYTEQDILPFYQGMIGKTIALSDIFTLADHLTAKYRNDGFILSQVIVPAQEIDSGTVHLQAVEGFIDNVTLQGIPAPLLGKIAAHVKEAKPLTAKSLERAALLMNDLAGVSVRTVLSPSPATSGAATLTVIAEDAKPYDANLQVDNRGTRYAGPLQLTAGTQIYSAFKQNETLGVQLMTAPDSQPKREMDYMGLSASRMINSYGTDLSLSTSQSVTRPGFKLTDFGIHGLSRSATVELTHPFIYTRAHKLTGHISFNTLNSRRSDNLVPDIIRDHLRSVRIGGTCDFTDDGGAANSLGAEVSHGLNILDATKTGSANMTRSRGTSDYTKITADASRTQHLFGPLTLSLSATAQKSANILLASEEFGAGGAGFGSAYDASEITGEDGFAGRAEVKFTNPDLLPELGAWQLYNFYDGGKVWDRDNTATKDKIRALASAGAGLRLSTENNISFSFEAAAPLTRPVETTSNTNPRFFLSLGARF